MTTTEILLWDVLPYVAITTFVVGTIWRYRYDKFGWTTRSSQLYERKLIRIASPLFHLGILAVVGGHVVGLLIPESWTEAVASGRPVPPHGRELGLFAGAATLIGVALLIYRRRTVGTGLRGHHEERQDHVRLPRRGHLPGPADHHDRSRRHRRRAQLPRGRLGLVPLDLLAAAAGRADGRRPAAFRVHALSGLLVFMIWPFTRLVHAFSAPLRYLFRPYVVYRDRGPHDLGSHAPRRGWEKIDS